MKHQTAMARNALEGATGKLSLEEHHAWAKKMWSRMDRNDSDTISRDELDCEELRSILRGVLHPDRASTGGTTYQRVQQNVEQACSFCLRKADLNSDGILSFEEFSSFLWYLTKQHHVRHTAHLIFALFDLDFDGRLDQYEFHEIYRFYVGVNPTADEFQQAWATLDRTGKGSVTLNEYCQWLQASTDPIFKQHAPEVGPSSPSGDPELKQWIPDRTSNSFKSTAGMSSSAKTIKVPSSPPATASTALPDSGAQTFHSSAAQSAYKMDFPDLPIHPSIQRNDAPRRLDWAEGLGAGNRPPWNRHLKVAGINDTVATLKGRHMKAPQGCRDYFSRTQSLPELQRYFATHKGFKKHRAEGAALREMPRKSPVLSTYMESTLQSRHEPGGTMKKHAVTGPVTPWEDNWLTPAYLKPRWKPGALDLKDIGPPPEWVLHFKEDAD